MHVVAAGVHNGDRFAGDVFLCLSAGVGEAGLFFNGVGIEVRAKKNDQTIAVFQDANDAVSADFFGDFVACIAKFLSDARGGFFFEMRELGIGVEASIETLEVREVFGESLIEGAS